MAYGASWHVATRMARRGAYGASWRVMPFRKNYGAPWRVMARNGASLARKIGAYGAYGASWRVWRVWRVGALARMARMARHLANSDYSKDNTTKKLITFKSDSDQC